MIKGKIGGKPVITAITLMEAYLLETPLSKGMSKQELISLIEQGNSEKLNSFDDTFDYANLINAYEKSPSTIKNAINSGYTIKFISINGINRIIQLKFGLKEGIDYELRLDKVIGIPLTKEELSTFKQILSPQWHIITHEKDKDAYEVDVLHQTLVG